MTQPAGTTNPHIDVNQAFHTERLNQISDAHLAADRARDAASKRAADFDKRVADGKMRNLGNGRYQVVDPGSWDNGEIFSVSLQAGGMKMLLPEHGLDVDTNGKAALYTTVPAWHGLGQVVPGGITDIQTVLELAGLNWTVTAEPLSYEWFGDGPVEGRPIIRRDPVSVRGRGMRTRRIGWDISRPDRRRTAPDVFATARSDTGAPLGTIGKMYANGGIIQNGTAFAFLQDLCQAYDVPFESAGAMRGGRNVFVSMRLPETVVIDADGINDEIVMFMVALNSFDGKSPFRVIVTPWRPLCQNTERFALRDAAVRWDVRHTSRALTNLAKARTSLNLTLAYVEEFKAEEEALARTTMTVDEFLAVCTDDKLWPIEDDAKKTGQTRHGKRMEELTGLFTKNAEGLGRTRYAGERAITEYLDHHVTVRPHESLKGPGAAVRATLALEGANDEKKSRAHKLLLLTR